MPPSSSPAHILFERVVLVMERTERATSELRLEIQAANEISLRATKALESLAASEARRIKLEEAQQAARGRALERVWETRWVQTAAFLLVACFVAWLSQQAGVSAVLTPLVVGSHP